MLMKCQEARRLLHDLLDDDILQSDRERLLGHLTNCLECRSANHSLNQTVALLQDLLPERAPEGFTTIVLNQLPPTPGKTRQFMRVLSIAAVLLVLLVSPIYLFDTMNSPQLLCQDRQASIVREEGQFVVPANQVVRGNVTVYKASLLVLGQVRGDVRMVDGHLIIQGEGNVGGFVSEQASSGTVRFKLALAELCEDIGGWFFRR